MGLSRSGWQTDLISKFFPNLTDSMILSSRALMMIIKSHTRIKWKQKSVVLFFLLPQELLLKKNLIVCFRRQSYQNQKMLWGDIFSRRAFSICHVAFCSILHYCVTQQYESAWPYLEIQDAAPQDELKYLPVLEAVYICLTHINENGGLDQPLKHLSSHTVCALKRLVPLQINFSSKLMCSELQTCIPISKCIHATLFKPEATITN